jgi:hypothetical protein
LIEVRCLISLYDFRYFTAEIIPLDSTTQPLNLKTYDIVTSILNVTEQIHGEFGAAAIKNGLEGKKHLPS